MTETKFGDDQVREINPPVAYKKFYKTWVL